MSKPFDYSKWDNIELSDDEDDVHPNIDRESWFRMKHRSRVEREENEEKDKKRIKDAMEKANKRIGLLQRDLKKIQKREKDDELDDDSDDEDDGTEAIMAEIKELQKENQKRQDKLDEYERNKKWNVDNLCHVVEERTIVNPDAAKSNFTSTGFAKSTVETTTTKLREATIDEEQQQEQKDDGDETAEKAEATKPSSKAVSPKAASAASVPSKTTTTTTTTPPSTVVSKPAGPAPPKQQEQERPSASTTSANSNDSGAMYSYHEFTQRYADLVEEFMAITDLEKSKEFLIKHGTVLLQENASNYLLLASLEDEMNGYRSKMKQTARQSQIISSIADLAKSLGTHPGNVILPFFARLEQREYLKNFLDGVESFQSKIIKRAVTKKIEMDRERERQRAEEGGSSSGAENEQGVALEDIPKEQRLGPGGLDPLEVIQTLPKEMVDAFESRDVENLKAALMKLDPKDAQYHMKRCVDSGLWVSNA